MKIEVGLAATAPPVVGVRHAGTESMIDRFVVSTASHAGHGRGWAVSRATVSERVGRAVGRSAGGGRGLVGGGWVGREHSPEERGQLVAARVDVRLPHDVTRLGKLTLSVVRTL